MLNKKRFKLWLIWIAIASSSFARTQAETIQNCYTIENEYTRQCEIIQPWETSTYNWEYNTITNIWNFNNNDLKVLWLKSAWWNNLNMWLFRNNWKLYNIRDYARINPTNWIGETKYVCKVNSTDYQDIWQYCWLTACWNNDNKCNIYWLKNYTTTIETFIEDTNTQTPNEYIIMYSQSNAPSRWTRICAKYDSFTYCIAVNPYYIKTYKSDIMQIIEQWNASQWETLTYYSNMFQNSPFRWTTTTITTWTICPMIQFQIDMYGRKYNTWLCYTNTIEYTWWQIQQVQPQTIFEIFNSYTEYINWYNLWNNNCHAPYTQEHCNTVMNSNFKATQIFNKIENAWVDSEKVYQYCHLQLNFTEEQKRTIWMCQIEEKTDQPQYATWTNNQNSNPNPLEWITNILEKGIEEPPVPSTWTVFDEILPEWVISRKDVLLDYKFYSHFALLYTKVTNLFKARWYQEWIIPPYITSLLLLILLFKIYKK